MLFSFDGRQLVAYMGMTDNATATKQESTMIKLAYPMAGIRKLLPAVSTEETCYYLKGIMFEPGGIAVATDGTVLGAYHAVESFGPVDRAVIVSFAKIKLPKAKRFGSDVQRFVIWQEGAALMAYAWTPRNDEDTFTVAAAEHIGMVRYIDGTFPDWRQIMPRDLAASTVKPLHLGTPVIKQIAAMCPNGVRLDATDTERRAPLYFRDSDKNFIGVVMPLTYGKAEAMERPLPEWVRPAAPAAAGIPTADPEAKAA